LSVELSMSDDFHFRREDRGERWQRIADHLARNPDDVDIALENITRWLDRGRVHPGPILEWRRRIVAARSSEEAFRRFLDELSRNDCDANPLKSCSPFVGLPFSSTSPTTVPS